MAHVYWRLNISANNSSPNTSIAEVELRGTVSGADQCTGGTASASGDIGAPYAAAMAFDNTTTTMWNTGGTGWLRYQFASAVDVAEYTIRSRHDGFNSDSPRDWTLEYSDDGSAWTVADTRSSQTAWGTGETRTFTLTVAAGDGARLSQVTLEVLRIGTAVPVELSQVALEVLRTGAAVAADLSQVALEVLRGNGPETSLPVEDEMPNLILWSAPDAIQTPHSTGLNSLANNARAVSAFISSTRDQYADLELLVTFAVAPSATGYVALYLMPSLDETNFADGDATLVPAANMQVGTFTPQANTSAQRLYVRQVIVSPVPYRWLLWNRGGQAFAASGNTLRTRTYSPEMQ